MLDTYRHKGMRRRLIEELAEKGIKSKEVLNAMQQIPRHAFLEKAFEEIAYEDKAFPIGEDQTISQPFTVAYQTQLLNIKKREKVLEIGTGSGYQASVLAGMGARVYTIERQKNLYDSANKMFQLLGLLGIRTYFRDGYKGLPELAPFENILVTAAAPYVPEPLKEQLTIGGILVIPVGGRTGQRMHKIVRVSERKYEEEILDNFRFVPMLKGKNY